MGTAFAVTEEGDATVFGKFAGQRARSGTSLNSRAWPGCRRAVRTAWMQGLSKSGVDAQEQHTPRHAAPRSSTVLSSALRFARRSCRLGQFCIDNQLVLQRCAVI